MGINFGNKEVKEIYVGVELKPITTPGIYHNIEEGLISLSSDGSDWITIADKNLGATTVYNNGDTLSEANCGKYYQWGNNFGFTFSGAIRTSSSQVNASSYGPSNYYSSSTFSGTGTLNGQWDSSGNNNLWGGVTNTNEARKGPCLSGYHIPTSDELDKLKNDCISLGLSASEISNYLKIPFAGIRFNTSGNVAGLSQYANLWSSSYNASYSNWAYALVIRETTITLDFGNRRGYGASIRPFKNEGVQPREGWTKLY